MEAPLGVILAGGRASRMGGGDKALLPFGTSTLLDHVIARFSPQVEDLAINANGDPSRFKQYSLPVIADSTGDFLGPLAGILAGLEWAATYGGSHIVTVAADTPFLPLDLVPRLLLAAEVTGRPVVLASTNGTDRHPTFGLWPVHLKDDLARSLGSGTRKVTDWADRHGTAIADFSTKGADPFFNINTPQDLAAALAQLG
jgi:molybdenum cofactor guanylyltransferase